MASTPDRMRSRLARHRAFWRGDPVDRPLLGLYLGGYEVPDVYRVAADGDALQPGQLLPERFFEVQAARCEALEQFDQDLLRPVSPLYCVPWLEALLGCSVYVHSDVCWPERLLPAHEPLESLELGLSQPWLDGAADFIDALAGHPGNRWPVAGLFLRGPIDAVAAIVGTERMFYELGDRPEPVHRLLDRCARAWVEVSRRLQSHLPSFNAGYVDAGRWLWAPGPIAYTSEDTTAMVSEAMYRQHFLPHNRHIVASYPYGYIHRHSVSAHNAAALLDLDTAWGIEVTMDPTGPSVAEILPLLRLIQERGRRLIVFGLCEEDEVCRAATGLSPRGLCLVVQADAPERAHQLLAAARASLP